MNRRMKKKIVSLHSFLITLARVISMPFGTLKFYVTKMLNTNDISIAANGDKRTCAA